jgi:hypothetical protein
MIARERRQLPVKWSLSTSTVAYFLQRGHKITVRYRFKGLVRSAALKRERYEIARLIKMGTALANRQHNPQYRDSLQALVRNIHARIRRRSRP